MRIGGDGWRTAAAWPPADGSYPDLPFADEAVEQDDPAWDGSGPEPLPWSAPVPVAAPLLPALLAVAAMLPQGLNIRPGGVMLTSPRLVLLAALPVIAMRLLKPRPDAAMRFGPCDAVVILAGIWMFLSVSMIQGVARAAVGSTVDALEFCGTYFLMRTCLSRPGEAVAVARLLATVIAVDGCLSVLDVIMQRPFMLDLAGTITGYHQDWQRDYRHGLMRALGMQEHPIQLGNVCAFGALLSLTLLRGGRRALTFAGCFIGLVTSNSSAPIMGFLLSCMLLMYNRLTAGIGARWYILMGGAGTLLALLFTLHPAPFSFLIMHTAAVPQDGFYRLLIWNIVGPLVLDSPLFGLGLESDFAVRFHVNNTIDCFWLASAAMFGIVGSASFAATLLLACWQPVRRFGLMAETDLALGRALGIIVFLYFFIGMTVHFWGTVWILMSAFAAMRAHLGNLSALQRALEGELAAEFEAETEAAGREPFEAGTRS